MGMQTDVSTVHLNQTGFGYIGRIRIKGLVISNTATGGTVNIYDTTVAPTVGVTYARSGFVVTVTSVAHGLSTGAIVGISFGVGTGGSATNGNYAITRTGADTFTLTDINSGTINAGAACSYVASATGTNSTQWHASFDTGASAGMTNIVFPGEGILIENGLYALMTPTNITSVTFFYG